MPGQLGPMTRDFFCERKACLTFTISCWGIPELVIVHTVCDDDDQLNFSLDSFQYGVSGCRWWHVDHTSVAFGVLLGLLAVLKDWKSEVGGAGLLRGHTANHLGAVQESLFSLEGSLS